MPEDTNPTLMKTNKTADRKTYMREYMKKRYAEKPEECRNYKRSVQCKISHNLPPEELKEYGEYLADIYKLRQIKERLPADLFVKITASAIV